MAQESAEWPAADRSGALFLGSGVVDRGELLRAATDAGRAEASSIRRSSAELRARSVALRGQAQHQRERAGALRRPADPFRQRRLRTR